MYPSVGHAGGGGLLQSMGGLEWEDSSTQFRQCVLAPPKPGFPGRQCPGPPPHCTLSKKFTFHLDLLKNKQTGRKLPTSFHVP